VSKKFTFTQQDLDDMIIEALNSEPESTEGKKPSVIERLLAEKKLQDKRKLQVR